MEGFGIAHFLSKLVVGKVICAFRGMDFPGTVFSLPFFPYLGSPGCVCQVLDHTHTSPWAT